ncbi:uncharacterized protein LOC144488702, partial [Mustelus asterias]
KNARVETPENSLIFNEMVTLQSSLGEVTILERKSRSFNLLSRFKGSSRKKIQDAERRRQAQEALEKSWQLSLDFEETEGSTIVLDDSLRLPTPQPPVPVMIAVKPKPPPRPRKPSPPLALSPVEPLVPSPGLLRPVQPEDIKEPVPPLERIPRRVPPSAEGEAAKAPPLPPKPAHKLPPPASKEKMRRVPEEAKGGAKEEFKRPKMPRKGRPAGVVITEAGREPEEQTEIRFRQRPTDTAKPKTLAQKLKVQ